MDFSIGQAVWVQEGTGWFRGAVEGAMAGPRHDLETRYAVRWWDGGGFGIRYGNRRESQLLPVIEDTPGGQFGVV